MGNWILFRYRLLWIVLKERKVEDLLWVIFIFFGSLGCIPRREYCWVILKLKSNFLRKFHQKHHIPYNSITLSKKFVIVSIPTCTKWEFLSLWFCTCCSHSFWCILGSVIWSDIAWLFWFVAPWLMMYNIFHVLEVLRQLSSLPFHSG